MIFVSKIDEFKEFVKTKPELVTLVSDNKASWQKLFETYDLYGDKESVWKELLKKEETRNISVKGILNSLNNIDTESFQNNINSIQKAIGFLQELTTDNKKDKKIKGVKKAQNYKTFDKFYSD